MSDCQRWEPLDDSTMRQSAEGGWVLIGDYSCLKREAYVLRLEYKDLQTENAKLNAENERLRQAGDAIIMITSQYVTDSTLRNLALREWNAAKEGKPSV